MKPLLYALCLSAALSMLSPAPARAQVPAGPIKVLIGFPAGGPPDLVLRKVADKLQAQFGTPVVVENRPGASGTIAAAAVARAEPDGRTLLFGVAANLAVAPATMRAPPYDPTQAFTPIVEVARGPYVLLVRSDAPARTYAEFLGWARAQPGKLNYATPGNGSVHHLAMELLRASQGLELVHVPYRTTVYQPLLAGDAQVLLESMPGPLPHLSAGTLRALAVTGARRLERLPDVPTLDELGVKGLEVNSWWGFVGPAGLPRGIVDTLNAAIRKALGDAELRATLAGWSIEPTPGSADDFARYIAAENRRWRAQVERMGLVLE